MDDQQKPTMLGAISLEPSQVLSPLHLPQALFTPFAFYYNRNHWRDRLFLGVFSLKAKFGYDDALDAFGLHGIGGTWGGIATGLFATTSVNDGGANGLFYGDPSLLWKQVVAIVATYAFLLPL
ncbi:hypothetical protein BsIDN1_64430 [Bacillus safensis]|uniref:Ammonium transporter AmtB-like domain-containing protein n=1 Tax=Bacillus safensis TaxID=561879 RepID=A0A5S9MJ65_BACIA|nr:hypothetical protein BsIDN1_64430 [Bacillus safensis]